MACWKEKVCRRWPKERRTCAVSRVWRVCYLFIITAREPKIAERHHKTEALVNERHGLMLLLAKSNKRYTYGYGLSRI